ncbi:hypothetical protein H4R34_000216 [Dimargaris verticillata]|uniref:Uncharacterized protein n=1 Tax=Dimargaris verticillata TaxID=2761393 RepID=A0A9W8BDU3_9FUNG|nr:hypothetical protein H4R34_000216 [Dimargaris verticillata]
MDAVRACAAPAPGTATASGSPHVNSTRTPFQFILSDAIRARIAHQNRVAKIARALRSKLSYAKFKVDHGWQDKPFEQVVTLCASDLTTNPLAPSTLSPRKRLKQSLERAIPGISFASLQTVDPQSLPISAAKAPVSSIKPFNTRHFSYPPRLGTPRSPSPTQPSRLKRSFSTTESPTAKATTSVGSDGGAPAATLVHAAETMLMFRHRPTGRSALIPPMASPGRTPAQVVGASPARPIAATVYNGYHTPYSPSIRSTLQTPGRATPATSYARTRPAPAQVTTPLCSSQGQTKQILSPRVSPTRPTSPTLKPLGPTVSTSDAWRTPLRSTAMHCSDVTGPLCLTVPSSPVWSDRLDSESPVAPIPSFQSHC